jgi:hypothetical protein
MSTKLNPRWKIKKVCVETCFFIITNQLKNKDYLYQVPDLESLALVDDSVFVTTKSNKILHIDLISEKRKFVKSASILTCVTKPSITP